MPRIYACIYLCICCMYVWVCCMYGWMSCMYVVELLVWMHVLNRCGASSRASLTTPRVTSFKSLEKVLLLPVGVVEGGGLVIWDRYSPSLCLSFSDSY